MITSLTLVHALAVYCFILSPACWLRGEVVTWRTEPPGGLSKTELHFETDFHAKQGVLILCPGLNGDGKILLDDRPWRIFAKDHGLGLVSISFASPPALLYGNPARGYYYPEQGSGEVLLRGLKEHYGRDLKILFYGFSAGAQFGSRFVELYPDRILSWAAYSASFWRPPMSANRSTAPGIVACGEFDAERYGPSFAYFQQGRRMDARWTWVSIGNVGHMRHKRFEEFVRAYFAAVLDGEFDHAQWLDAETKHPTSEDERILNPALSAWLPTPEVADLWLKLHHP